jgi:hypothetical protein
MSRFLIAAALVALTARASADQAKAQTYFRAGEAAFLGQNFGAAADQFEQAYREDPLPAIAFSAAQAYRKEYEIEPKPEYVKRAVELYRAYLDVVKTGHRVGDAAAGLEEMQHELDRLTAKGTKIEAVNMNRTRVAVSITVAGDRAIEMTETASMPASDDVHAKATLDGKPIELFAPLDVAPGDHTVAVTADGYQPQTVTRRVPEGVTELVELQLQPKPAHLTVHAQSGARVEVNGRALGDAPLTRELPAGTYLVGISRRGREPVSAQLVLARGEDKTLEVPMTRSWKRRAVPWLALSAGVLAIGAGVSVPFALHYDREMSSLDHERLTTGITQAQEADYRHDVSMRDELRDTAWTLGGVAVAVGVVTAALYWFDTPEVGEHAQVIPTATGTSAGLSLVGAF